MGGKLVATVPMWICRRPVENLPVVGKLFSHEYVCCDGANQNCYGHAKNNLKKGEPIPPEGNPTGDCDKKMDPL
jgi:hypothetical protein